MKRFIASLLLVAAMAFGCLTANAQFRYSAIAGPVFSTLKFKDPKLVDVSGTTGFTLGIQGEMMFPGIGFGLDLGLLYNQSGAKVNLGQREIWNSLGFRDVRVYLHNIHIPFHLRFKWTRMNGLEDYIAPLVFGGPDFYIQAAHGKCDAFKYSGGDLGITVGGGFELFTRWQVTATYTWGMTYVLKTKLLDNFSARDRQLTFRLAYMF